LSTKEDISVQSIDIDTTIMPLDALPPEILMAIADHIAEDESEGRHSDPGFRFFCHFRDDEDEHHSSPKSELPKYLRARSRSFWNLASVSRHIRDMLFIAPDSRSITVWYEGRDWQSAVGIRTSLLAKVK
jgi:hypothetical protein